MIEIGTRVSVHLSNPEGNKLYPLLTRLGGVVVKGMTMQTRHINYLVAFDKKHLEEIHRARRTDLGKEPAAIECQTLGHLWPVDFPGDGRYFILAFDSEIQPA